MSNMSYCQFQNTAPDLKDCLDNMNDLEAPDADADFEDTSEWRARRRLIKYAVAIAESYGHELEEDD